MTKSEETGTSATKKNTIIKAITIMDWLKKCDCKFLLFYYYSNYYLDFHVHIASEYKVITIYVAKKHMKQMSWLNLEKKTYFKQQYIAILQNSSNFYFTCIKSQPLTYSAKTCKNNLVGKYIQKSNSVVENKIWFLHFN